VVLGLAFSSVFLCCIHHGVFLVLLLGLTAWITIPLPRWRTWLAGVALAAITAAVFLLPLLLPMRQILKQHGFVRPASKVQALSATVSAWAQTLPGTVTGFIGTGRRSPRPLSPGWVRTGLALVGVLLAMRVRRDQRAVMFLTALGCWAFVWSFGTNLRIGGWQPWHTLADWAPGFSQVRSAYRFAYFVQLSVVLLAAWGLDRLSRCRTSRAGANRARWLRNGLFVVLCGLVAFEVPPAPVRLVDVPDVSAEPPWVAFLRRHTAANQAVVCLPFADGYSAKDCEQTGRWMLYGTRHGVSMANGYSGFFPKSWFRMVETLKADPFSEPTVDMLVQVGVEYVVIDPRLMPASQSPEAVSGRHRLVRVFRDESGVEIWRIQ
jgi:hypothetical protein